MSKIRRVPVAVDGVVGGAVVNGEVGVGSGAG